MAFVWNPFTDELDATRSDGELDARYIRKAPTATEIATGLVPSDFGWNFRNDGDSSSGGVRIVGQTDGIALVIDLEQTSLEGSSPYPSFAGGRGILVKLPQIYAAYSHAVGPSLAFSGKSNTAQLQVGAEKSIMGGIGSTEDRTLYLFGGGLGFAFGVTRAGYLPGSLVVSSASWDANPLSVTPVAKAVAQSHLGRLWTDTNGVPKWSRQCASVIGAACGAGYGDPNILLLVTCAGLAAHVGKPIWPYSVDEARFEYCSANPSFFGANYGDKEAWIVPFILDQLQENGTFTGTLANISGTAGNTFLTCVNNPNTNFAATRLVALRKSGSAIEYHKITSITGTGPWTINLAYPLVDSYTGVAAHTMVHIPWHAVRLQPNSGATSAKTEPEFAYFPANASGRGFDAVIAGEVYASTDGFRMHMGSVGVGQIAVGLAAVQVADAKVDNALDKIFVTPTVLGAAIQPLSVTAVNAPAGTFTVNCPVAVAGAPLTFYYLMTKHILPV